VSIAAVILALALSGAPEPMSAAPQAPQAEEPTLSAACRQALQRDWDKLSSEADDGRAVVLISGLETACSADREALGLLMGFHAEIDLKAGRYAEAVGRLERAPLRPADGIWPTTRWTYLTLLEMTGDAEAFRRVRDELVAAHDKALQTHARHRMRRVERFETPAAMVDAYEGAAQQGSFRRLAVFVATPKNGGMPVTMTLTRSMGVEALLGDRGGAAYFFDLYPCGSHVNLGMPRGTAARPPSYATAKAKAKEVFERPDAFPAFVRREEPRACGFASYMLPGFDAAEARED
jgi:hypothetical protein